ncbi:hypothetical protein A9976_00455 [Delftia sp. UME58]|nr:hypothetical protein [Delftia sp. UME58]
MEQREVETDQTGDSSDDAKDAKALALYATSAKRKMTLNLHLLRREFGPTTSTNIDIGTAKVANADVDTVVAFL